MKFCISEEDYIAIQRLHLGWKLWGIRILICLMGATFVTSQGLATQGVVTSWLHILCSFGFFACVAFILMPIMQRKQFKKIYSEQKSLHEEVEVKFDEQHIGWSSKSGHFKLKWEDIMKYKENNEIILIYESRNLMRPLLKGYFQDQERLETFLRRLKERKDKCGRNQPHC